MALIQTADLLYSLDIQQPKHRILVSHTNFYVSDSALE